DTVVFALRFAISSLTLVGSYLNLLNCFCLWGIYNQFFIAIFKNFDLSKVLSMLRFVVLFEVKANIHRVAQLEKSRFFTETF
ncbi:25009_t:CDS:1, partial [Racocetra persica]